MAAPDTAVNEFVLFPTLPTELRLKIWRHVLFLSPRTVELCQLQDSKYIKALSHPDEDTVYRTTNSARFYSPTAVPVLLQAVNKESRSVALEHYTLSFPNKIGSHPARTWFCADLDLLYFPSWCFKDSLDHFELGVPEETKANIKRLGRDNLVWYAPPWDPGSINYEINIVQFPNLEEFVYVQRNTEHLMCACCLEYDGPEAGAVDLRFGLKEGGWMTKCRIGFEEAVEEISTQQKEKGQKWMVPKLSFAVLLRDGKEI